MYLKLHFVAKLKRTLNTKVQQNLYKKAILHAHGKTEKLDKVKAKGVHSL